MWVVVGRSFQIEFFDASVDDRLGESKRILNLPHLAAAFVHFPDDLILTLGEIMLSVEFSHGLEW